MKISVFGTRGFPGIQGGVEKHCENLYSQMPSEFKFTVFRRKAYLNAKSTIQYDNIRFIDIVSTKVKGFETFFHSFICTLYCLFQRPDIIHVHNIGPGIFIPILKLFKLKVVLTYHSPNYEHKKWGKFAKLILKIGELFSIHGADIIIFVNQNQKDKYPYKIQQKSYFIPNGIIRQAVSNKKDYIKKLELTPQKYIFTVGRITEEKGFDYLIEAYAASAIKSSYKLVIAGGVDHNSSFAKTIEEKAIQHGVILTGYTEGEQLQQLYSHARLFILPSYNEGFPLVLLEAINYKLPILASDIPGNKQIKLPQAAYFAVGDKEQVREKLEHELNKEFTSCSYNQIVFTWKEISLQVCDIYKKLAHIDTYTAKTNHSDLYNSPKSPKL